MAVDKLLAWIGRRLCRVRGGRRLVAPLRRHYSRIYDGRPDRWAVIHDYRGGLRFKVDRSAYMGGAIYWQGWHHLLELNYIERVVREDDVFIDAGANTGEFTVAVAARVPAGAVLAFEPQAEMHAILTDNVVANALENVRLFRDGLADGEGEALLYTSDDRELFSGVHEGLYTQYPQEDRSVPAGRMKYRPLDAVLDEVGVSRVDWLKVDVEGGELPVLRGATAMLARCLPRLIVEFNEQTFQTAGYAGADLDAFLRKFGYVPHRFTPQGLTPIDITSIGQRTCNLLFMTETRP